MQFKYSIYKVDINGNGYRNKQNSLLHLIFHWILSCTCLQYPLKLTYMYIHVQNNKIRVHMCALFTHLRSELISFISGGYYFEPIDERNCRSIDTILRIAHVLKVGYHTTVSTSSINKCANGPFLYLHLRYLRKTRLLF